LMVVVVESRVEDKLCTPLSCDHRHAKVQAHPEQNSLCAEITQITHNKEMGSEQMHASGDRCG
jgi:hypothetical protein